MENDLKKRERELTENLNNLKQEKTRLLTEKYNLYRRLVQIEDLMGNQMFESKEYNDIVGGITDLENKIQRIHEKIDELEIILYGMDKP